MCPTVRTLSGETGQIGVLAFAIRLMSTRPSFLILPALFAALWAHDACAANRSTAAELGRRRVRSGHAQADAQRLSRALAVRHGESSRDRMRQVFKDVPAIYGFSGVAPLGPTAGSLLHRYFQTSGTGDI